MQFDVADNGGGIGASDNVLAATFELDQKAMASAAVIAEIGSDHYVAEIAPVAEQSATAAESQSPRRGIARVDRRDLAVGEISGSRDKPVKHYARLIRFNGHGTIIESRNNRNPQYHTENHKPVGFADKRDYADSTENQNCRRNNY